MHLKMPSEKCRPFCSGVIALNAGSSQWLVINAQMQNFPAVVPAPDTTYNPPESINTIWYHYNSVNFLKHSRNRHTIAHPWGWGMGVSVVSLKFDLCSVNCCYRSAVCNIPINWTELLQLWLYLACNASHEICTWFVFCWSVWYWTILHTSFRVTLLALGQSYDCPSVSEVTLKTWVKSANIKA